MKKIVSLILVCVLTLCLLCACGDEKSGIPEGYTLYENDDISFAYPEDWSKTDGSVMTLAGENGNNVTVVYEAKTDVYEKLTTESFKTNVLPLYTQMGLTVTNPSVEQTETNGLSVTKISQTMSVLTQEMDQTQYITTIDDKTYTITVTEVVADDTLVQTVFDTLTKVE